MSKILSKIYNNFCHIVAKIKSLFLLYFSTKFYHKKIMRQNFAKIKKKCILPQNSLFEIF